MDNENRLLKYTSTSEEIDLFYSRNMTEEFGLKTKEDLEDLIEDTLINFEANSIHRTLIDLNAKKRNLSRKAILFAHGVKGIDSWKYNNETEELEVQDWIDELDGKYAALILRCCNTGSKEGRSYEVVVDKSTVLAYNFLYSEENFKNGEGRVELCHPDVGYIDSYTEEYYLEIMRREA